MACLAHFYKQEVVDGVFADLDLVIRRSQAPDDAASAPKRARRASSSGATAGTAAGVAAQPLQLAKIPAHKMILITSEYFKAQQHWQASPQPPAASTGGAGSSSARCGSGAALAARPTVHLTIDSAEQLPAAEAVIAAMYGVPDAISNLEQQQLVHVTVIADIVHAGTAQQQAKQALQAAAESEHGLSAAALQQLAGLFGWPSCLLQLLPTIVEHAPCCQNNAADLAAVAAADAGGSMRQILVTVFGDLQALWANEELSQLLLGLPLPAMQLLLSSDQLRVPSEDTVLYTAKRYARAQKRAARKSQATAALAPLVRAPQLSLFALSCAALPADSHQQLLGCFAQQLRELLFLKHSALPAELTTSVAALEDAPSVWQLAPRQIRPLEDGVRLEWRLPVEQLKQACRDSFTQQDKVWLDSPGSPPMTGVAWGLKVRCMQQGGGTVVGVYAGPVIGGLSAGSYYRMKFTVVWHGGQHTYNSSCLGRSITFWGHGNYFGLQPMAGGGWDEALWAAAGLPATGELLLQLHMHRVE